MHGNEEVILEGEQLNCETCGSEFTKEKVLQNHMKRHSSEIGGGKFKCEYCLIYLTRKDSLKRHMKNRPILKKHMSRCGREVFPCGEHCDERFVSMYNRKRHLENLETITCTECGKKLKGWLGVKRHMKKLHSEKKAEKCKYCMGQYTETYMKRHIKLKHSNEKALEGGMLLEGVLWEANLFLQQIQEDGGCL